MPIAIPHVAGPQRVRETYAGEDGRLILDGHEIRRTPRVLRHFEEAGIKGTEWEIGYPICMVSNCVSPAVVLSVLQAGERAATAEPAAATMAQALRELLDMIAAQGRHVTPEPKRESEDDANSRDERDQILSDAIVRANAALDAFRAVVPAEEG